jgi:hypothetical protein
MEETRSNDDLWRTTPQMCTKASSSSIKQLRRSSLCGKLAHKGTPRLLAAAGSSKNPSRSGT